MQKAAAPNQPASQSSVKEGEFTLEESKGPTKIN